MSGIRPSLEFVPLEFVPGIRPSDVGELVAFGAELAPGGGTAAMLARIKTDHDFYNKLTIGVVLATIAADAAELGKVKEVVGKVVGFLKAKKEYYAEQAIQRAESAAAREAADGARAAEIAAAPGNTGVLEQRRDPQGRFLSPNGQARPGLQFEQRVSSWARANLNDVADQVTIRPRLNNGQLADYTVRVDTIGRSRTNGAIELFDGKSTPGAGFTTNQRPGYPLIERNGGVVVGENGGVLYPAGTPIPPTEVQLIRPSDLPAGF